MQLFATSGASVRVFTTSGQQVFGPPQREPTDSARLTVLTHVANNSARWRTATATPSAGMTQMFRHTLLAPVKALRATFSMTKPGAYPAGLRFRAGLDISGTYWPLTFGGQRDVALTDESIAESDPLSDTLVVEAGTAVTTIVEHAGGGYFPSGTLASDGALVSGRYQGPYQGTAQLSLTTLAGSPITLAGLSLPATERVPSILLVGDSFMDRGWAHHACEAHAVAWSDWSVWLDVTHTSPIPGVMHPDADMLPYDAVYVGWGGNDRSKPLDVNQADSIKSWRMFERLGQKVGTKTLHPYTNSSDGYTTVSGQALKYPAEEPNRLLKNAWLRDGAPLNPATDAPGPTGTTDSAYVRVGELGHPLTYPVFDEADATETARDSGMWRVDGGAWTDDGAHLTGHGSSSLRPYFEAWLGQHVV